MPKFIDLTGQKFSKLTVMKYAGNSKWFCKCDCGNNVLVKAGNLKNGHTKSCGCLKIEINKKCLNQYIDLTGRKFGRLTVLERVDIKNNIRYKLRCKCDCGNITLVNPSYLKNGHTQSCGCLASEKAEKIALIAHKAYFDKYLIENTSIALITMNKLYKNNTSGKTGVKFHKGTGKWQADITFKGTRYYLGIYDKKEDAIEVREYAEKELYGNFLKWYKETYPEKWRKINVKAKDNQS